MVVRVVYPGKGSDYTEAWPWK